MLLVISCWCLRREAADGGGVPLEEQLFLSVL